MADQSNCRLGDNNAVLEHISGITVIIMWNENLLTDRIWQMTYKISIDYIFLNYIN